jgi:hypothetical protein
VNPDTKAYCEAIFHIEKINIMIHYNHSDGGSGEFLSKISFDDFLERSANHNQKSIDEFPFSLTPPEVISDMRRFLLEYRARVIDHIE